MDRLLTCLNQMDMGDLSNPDEKKVLFEEIEFLTQSLTGVATDRLSLAEIYRSRLGGGTKDYFYFEVTRLNDNLARRVIRKCGEATNLSPLALKELLDDEDGNE